MISDKLAEEMLKSIASTGAALPENAQTRHLLGENLIHVLNLSSGAPRLQTGIIGRFKLILSQPAILSSLSALSVRCSLCKQVVSYPCWYYSLKMNVNHFHYFICFRPTDDLTDEQQKPNCKCYCRS